MNELVQQIAQKTGIGEDKARQAAETVLSYLRTKLPVPVAGQLDAYLQGGESKTGNVMDKLSGFGKAS